MKNCIFLIFLYFFTSIIFSRQAAWSEEKPESLKEAFEEAMEKFETKRLQEQEKLKANLKSKLNLAIEEWISSAKKNKDAELNKFIDQNWEKQARSLDIPPVHYDYYLRDYAYGVTKTDIIKTDSLVAPYKANVNLIEKLYVERYHAPSISYREDFLCTVTTPITVSLEYTEDKFTVINTEYGKISIEKGWPEEIKEKLFLR